MTRPQLILAECVIIAIGLAVVALIIAWPSGREDAASASAQITVRATTVASPAASAGPSPTAAPDEECAPAADGPFLSANTIVSYYGHPYAETLGILGQHEPEEVASLLGEHARQIDELNGSRGVQPAFHMVWGTAQPRPGNDGLYVLHVDPETTREYIDLACRHGFLVFLDLQNGRSDPLDELRRIEPYLRQGHVHVALDPEFTMREGEIPGEVIGHVTAEQINAVQTELERIVQENNLPDKILVIHQFDEGMIRDREAIRQFPDVHVVVDMDGFGPGEVKIRKYWMFSQPAEYGGIKIFFEQDNPRLSDSDIVALKPEVIIYQ